MNSAPRVPPHAPGNLEPVHPDVAYDHTDVKPRSVLAFLFYFALGLALTYLVVWGSLRLIESRTARFDSLPSPVRQGVQKDIPPEPRLQGVPAHRTDPQQDLRDMRSKDEADLNSYGWVDKPNGIARMPITEAMKIIVEKGVASPEAKPAAQPAEKK